MFLRLIVILPLLISSPVSYSAPQPVIVTTVELQPFVETLEALGTLRSNEAVTITATVSDTIKAIHFDDGQTVERGSVLVEMTSDEEHALLEEARFAQEEAERQYKRVKSLAKTNLATESLLDERWRAYQSAQTQYLAMQSRMADRIIVAPFSGVLGLRNISVGTLVRPGDAITTLDDDSSMKLDMSLPSLFIDAVRPGQSIQAQAKALADQSFQGQITAVDSRIDANTRSIVVRAKFANPNHILKSGMQMTVQLQKPKVEVILLPEEALIQEGFRSYVYKLNTSEATTVEKLEVQTGSRRLGAVVISSGLAPGDRVVTHGVMRLKQGAEVSVHAEQTGKESLRQLLNSSDR